MTLPYFLRRAVRTLDALNIWSRPFETRRDHVHSIKREAVVQRSQYGEGAHAWAIQCVGALLSEKPRRLTAVAVAQIFAGHMQPKKDLVNYESLQVFKTFPTGNRRSETGDRAALGPNRLSLATSPMRSANHYPLREKLPWLLPFRSGQIAISTNSLSNRRGGDRTNGDRGFWACMNTKVGSKTLRRGSVCETATSTSAQLSLASSTSSRKITAFAGGCQANQTCPITKLGTAPKWYIDSFQVDTAP
jgi:hypothetical protein